MEAGVVDGWRAGSVERLSLCACASAISAAIAEARAEGVCALDMPAGERGVPEARGDDVHGAAASPGKGQTSTGGAFACEAGRASGDNNRGN